MSSNNWLVDIPSESFSQYGEFKPEVFLCLTQNVNYLEKHIINCKKNINVEEILTRYNFRFLFKLITKSGYDYIFVEEYNSCLVRVFTDTFSPELEHGFIALYCYIVNKYDCKDQLLTELYKYDINNNKVNKNKVNFIVKGIRLELIEKEIKNVNVDLDNYELSCDYESIFENVSNDKSGLILFSGSPGTGKSYLIRNLISNINKKFVYIPVNCAEIISDPSFMNFAINELSESVLIIEDGETILTDRQHGLNNAVSTILNITDGLLSELLNLKIIVTINVENNIDEALMRKGRLLNKVNFSKLPVDKANRTLKRLGKNITVCNEMILAELYNIDDNNGHEKIEKRKIGF